MKTKPLSETDLYNAALNHSPLDLKRVLATYADPKNWVQIYHGETSCGRYKAKACEWAFIGPMRPPYELAQWALKQESSPAAGGKEIL